MNSVHHDIIEFAENGNLDGAKYCLVVNAWEDDIVNVKSEWSCREMMMHCAIIAPCNAACHVDTLK